MDKVTLDGFRVVGVGFADEIRRCETRDHSAELSMSVVESVKQMLTERHSRLEFEHETRTRTGK